MKIYVSPDFLNFYSYPEFSDYNDDDGYKRPFEILKHAEDLLSGDVDKNYISDAIININRAITLRLNEIKRKFNFNGIPYLKNIDLWSRLEDLGLIRKHLINEINKIRNLIEHEDKGFPELTLCRLYLEFTWYFLKSTNLLCIRKLENISFEIDEYYWVDCRIDFVKNWEVVLYGWFDESLISNSFKDGYLLVNTNRFEKRIDILGPIVDASKDIGRGKKNEDLLIEGKVELNEDRFKRIYTYAFSMYQDT